MEKESKKLSIAVITLIILTLLYLWLAIKGSETHTDKIISPCGQWPNCNVSQAARPVISFGIPKRELYPYVLYNVSITPFATHAGNIR
jgi:hypothetical protein